VTHVSRPGHRRTSCTTVDFQDQVQITAGTALAEAGVDLAVIQALLGHAHVDSSVGYIHLAPVRVRAAYDTARERQRHQLRGPERRAQG
jgi:integrase/recombinase XerD